MTAHISKAPTTTRSAVSTMTDTTNLTKAPTAVVDATHPVVFDNVSLRFGQNSNLTIEEVSLTVERGKFLSVIGPSGCGKSTLLNLTAGLLKPTSGTVRHEGTKVSEIKTEIGYITQDPNLLPWLSVGANIGLPLKLRGASKAEQKAEVKHWVDLVGLTGWEDHFPRQLSGGMRKRASIARALITDPSLVLMDEPFGPLDAITRMKLQQDLLDLSESSDRTVIFVTHDLTEAICLSDEVAVMAGGPGKIKGILPVPLDRPRNILDLPESPMYTQLAKKLWAMFQNDADH
jgi:NitT/TauT family transport system ATP-binding protein